MINFTSWVISSWVVSFIMYIFITFSFDYENSTKKLIYLVDIGFICPYNTIYLAAVGFADPCKTIYPVEISLRNLNTLNNTDEMEIELEVTPSPHAWIHKVRKLVESAGFLVIWKLLSLKIGNGRWVSDTSIYPSKVNGE